MSSGTGGLPLDVATENPVGALAAASLGVEEVFKRLIKLRRERGDLLDGLSFSLRTYRTGEMDCGRELPSSPAVDLLLVGRRRDRERCHAPTLAAARPRPSRYCRSADLGEENLATCMLIGETNLGVSKAQTLAGYLSTPFFDA